MLAVIEVPDLEMGHPAASEDTSVPKEASSRCHGIVKKLSILVYQLPRARLMPKMCFPSFFLGAFD